MSVGVFVFDICVTLVLSAYLLYSYGNWMRQRIAVTLAVLIAWYFSFLIIFILPLDVSNTTYKQCLHAYNVTQNATIDESSAETTEAPTVQIKPACRTPKSHLSDDVLLNLWRVVYWSSQLLTWLVLPLMQSYTQAGEFTVAGKLKSALWDNSIYYASYLFIAVILIIYIALQPNLHLNMERLKAIAAAASNTWGLFVLVLMLGYGLVEVPRNCWNSAQRGYQLNRAYFKVAKLMTERTDAEEAVDDALISVNAVSEMVGQADGRRQHVETILNKIPLEMMEKIKRRRTESSFGNDPPTEKSLIRLHRQVIRSLQNLHRTEAQWADLTRRVFELEDINRNMISNEHIFKRTSMAAANEGRPMSLLRRTVWNPSVEWYWKCLLSPLLLRLAAGTAALMSALIIWSEVTFFSQSPPLSMFAIFVDLAKRNYNYLAIEIICFVTICYLSLCTYYTIFKIRILNYYYLASNHQSDEYTLLFSGALLCRLTPPLCLNFLSLIHMDSHVIHKTLMETSYTQVMGHMDVVSIVSDYFNIYFPIALLGLSLATYFSLGARVLSMVGFQQFLDQESEVTLEMVEEGKEHVKREKRRLQRMHESSARRRDYADRFRGQASSSQGAEEARYRAPDIVKSNAPSNLVSSPERSLLDVQSHSPVNSYSTDDRIDMESENPAAEQSTAKGPPRNLFDDW